MKLIDSSVSEIIQESGIDGMLKHIDYCCGICYNRKNVHDDSTKFITNMVARGHMRPLEFGTCKLIDYHYGRNNQLFMSIMNNKYSYYMPAHDGAYCVTTNFRVVAEETKKWMLAINGERKLGEVVTADMVMEECLKLLKIFWFDDSDEKNKDLFGYFQNRRTFDWVCSRAVADEFRTHITLSSLMKSTRYVNETKTGMCFIKPSWYGNAAATNMLYEASCEQCEINYNAAIAMGMKPQEAREMLLLGLATELYQCGVVDEEGTGWEKFVEMRDDSAAHPDAQKLCKELKNILYKNE